MQNMKKRTQAMFGNFYSFQQNIADDERAKRVLFRAGVFWQLYLLRGVVTNFSHFSEFINGVTC